MPVHVLTRPPTPAQLDEMFAAHRSFIKLAVDAERGVLAGGGDSHSDCEAALRAAGSRPDDVWGVDWRPASRAITFSALINVRPHLGNTSMVIRDGQLRRRIEQVVTGILAAEIRR